MDDREAKLPVWARDLIADLRRRVQYAVEPLVKELSQLRPKVELLTARNDALHELLQMAAKGGHIASIDVIAAIEGYELVLRERR